MNAADVYVDAYERIRAGVAGIAEGLDAAKMAYRPDDEANSIGWLLWHLTRVQDHNVAEMAGRDQAWVAGSWAAGFGLAADPEDTGYGHTSEQVVAVRPSGPDVVVEYHEAVASATSAYLATVDADELDRIIDTFWDPPVSVGVRLVSVIGDGYQHLGQAAYLRGLIERMS